MSDCVNPPVMQYLRSLGPGLHYVERDDIARRFSLKNASVLQELHQLQNRHLVKVTTYHTTEYAVRVLEFDG